MSCPCRESKRNITIHSKRNKLRVVVVMMMMMMIIILHVCPSLQLSQNRTTSERCVNVCEEKLC